jgi:hypothetical protein
LAAAYAMACLLPLADGSDEVHRNQIARLEFGAHEDVKAALQSSIPDPFRDRDVDQREEVVQPPERNAVVSTDFLQRQIRLARCSSIQDFTGSGLQYGAAGKQDSSFAEVCLDRLI